MSGRPFWFTSQHAVPGAPAGPGPRNIRARMIAMTARTTATMPRARFTRMSRAIPARAISSRPSMDSMTWGIPTANLALRMRLPRHHPGVVVIRPATLKTHCGPRRPPRGSTPRESAARLLRETRPSGGIEHANGLRLGHLVPPALPAEHVDVQVERVGPRGPDRNRGDDAPREVHEAVRRRRVRYLERVPDAVRR